MTPPFPDGREWPRADPAEVGMDPEAVAAAVDFAKTHDTPHEQVNHDFAASAEWDESEGEHGSRIGPMPDRRGGPSGMVLKGGRVVAEWGDTWRADDDADHYTYQDELFGKLVDAVEA
jgi:hypothetical protein